MTLYSYLKNIFWIGIMLIFAPSIVMELKEQYSLFITPRHKIGVLPIVNSITNAHSIIQDLNLFFIDKNIQGIVLYIECDGGKTGSAQMIVHEIDALKKEYSKPVIAIVENSCTAEGYIVACAADMIIASGAALIGGIKNFSEHAQHINDDIYTQTITAIAHKRKILIKDHLAWANGQLFTGNQALKLHLIDKIGSTTDAQRVIKERALIDGDVVLVDAAQKSCMSDIIYTIKKILRW